MRKHSKLSEAIALQPPSFGCPSGLYTGKRLDTSYYHRLLFTPNSLNLGPNLLHFPLLNRQLGFSLEMVFHGAP